jgi:uncharacterized membrane protein
MELIVAILVVAVIWLLFKVKQSTDRANEASHWAIELSGRMSLIERELVRLREGVAEPSAQAPSARTGPAPEAAPSLPAELLRARASAREAPQPEPELLPPAAPQAPPVLAQAAPAGETTAPPGSPPAEGPARPERPSILPLPPTLPRPVLPALPRINWEQFMGVKLFAWLGGLALFLGVAFFIKYSFERGWISPEIRVAMGFVTGLALLLTGLRLPRERYAVGVQSLSGAGILILYADIFASCSLYHFIPIGAAFALMALVTATAFLLAVRLEAQAVAVLGLIGGFLTPPLLSTGEDHPLGLFSYVAMLDVGLLAIALRQRWNYLTLLAAIATVAMQIGWVAKFFEAEKIGTAMTIYLVFAYLFVLALWLAQRLEQVEKFISAAAFLLPVAALVFAFYLLVYPYRTIAAQPGLLFGFVFAADLALLALAWLRDELRGVSWAAGAGAFLLLSIWTVGFLTTELLNWALGLYLVFAVLHSVFPIVLERVRPAENPIWWTQLGAPLALLLVMISMLKLADLSLVLWPVVLLADVLAIALAVVLASLWAVLAVLLLTGLATAIWIVKVPARTTGLPEMLAIIGGFAVFFFVVGVVVVRKISVKQEAAGGAEGKPAEVGPFGKWRLWPTDALAHIPAMSAILPFLLLTMVVLRLPLADPSPVFGLAALMVVLLLGVVRFYAVDALAAVGLSCTMLVECAWHFNRFTPEAPLPPLVWYLVFYALFGLFPFVFQARFSERLIPWAGSALAGPAQFFLVHRLAKAAFSGAAGYLGALPALFAVPSLIALVRLVRAVPPQSALRQTLLAIFGGVALFFITLIFPIQFDKQWITVGWALEGVALLWLLRRIPHEGLKVVGVGLLGVAFVRLALNPAVLHYHERTGTALFNWYLYAYGIVTVCLFAGAWLLAPPRNLLREVNVPPWLCGLGTVLAFLLVNVEIADYFSSGTTLTFQFSGNLGRDMTYSLGWALFAFIVLFVGIHRQLRPARYGGLGLLTVTLLKIFLHDLWSLGGLYRIGSLIGLALVLIPVSLFYQRFLAPGAGERTQAGGEGQ